MSTWIDVSVSLLEKVQMEKWTIVRMSLWQCFELELIGYVKNSRSLVLNYNKDNIFHNEWKIIVSNQRGSVQDWFKTTAKYINICYVHLLIIINLAPNVKIILFHFAKQTKNLYFFLEEEYFSRYLSK